jgi:hypothetical protein
MKKKFAFKKAKGKITGNNYIAAALFVILGFVIANLYTVELDAQTNAKKLEIWYKQNVPLGVAKGIHPGRVAWGHNPKIATWDGKTGFWWEEQFNNQEETDRLLTQTLITLTGIQKKRVMGCLIPLFQ